MIYKRDPRHGGSVIKAYPNGSWCSSDTTTSWMSMMSKLPDYEQAFPNHHVPSCLLEATLLRPELDYT